MPRRPSKSRRLPFFSALFPYLGGKRRLCPTIFREVDRLLPRHSWPERTFLDGFLGGGSVSLYAKAVGFSVVATDIAERSITVGRALVANSPCAADARGHAALAGARRHPARPDRAGDGPSGLHGQPGPVSRPCTGRGRRDPRRGQGGPDPDARDPAGAPGTPDVAGAERNDLPAPNRRIRVDHGELRPSLPGGSAADPARPGVAVGRTDQPRSVRGQGPCDPAERSRSPARDRGRRGLLRSRPIRA